MRQSLAYYHERLAQTPAALEYLRAGARAAAEPFGLGFADRTLGLRLPFRNRQDGEALRTRLQKLGLLRESGHEHFNGCIVLPIQNAAGQGASRRASSGDLRPQDHAANCGRGRRSTCICPDRTRHLES